MARAKSYTMESSPGYQLMLTSRVHEARIEQALQRLGISRAEFTVLYAIDRGSNAPADIVGFLDVQRAAVEATVTRLASAGLVEPMAEAGGRVQVTEAGRSVLTEGVAAAVEANARIRSALSPKEQEQFFELLERVRDGETVRRSVI